MKTETSLIEQMRDHAVQIFYQGLQAVEPGNAIKKYCKRDKNRLYIGCYEYDLSGFKHVYVVGAGKAAAPMAAALEELLQDDLTEGLINVKYGHIEKLNKIVITEAGHPVPDKNGEQGTHNILKLVRSAGRDDLIICIISGGGSALLPLPAQGLTLKNKQDTTKALLSCGASIHEINALRKHTSQIKGGRLAQEGYPARLVSLILSDVVGDDLDVIASGPTVPDKSTFYDCMKIFEKYHLKKKLPESVLNHIKNGVNGTVPETPKTEDPIFEEVRSLIIGSNIEALIAAKEKATALGYNTLVLSSMIEGDTCYAAHVHAAVAKEIIQSGNPVKTPACILTGGETTVDIRGKGTGGRNQEFSLAFAAEISQQGPIVILSAGTDGTDGPTDAAGAFADATTMQRASRLGIDPFQFLSDNDSYHFFKQLNDLLMTGPTNTNVMDLRIILVG